MTGVVKVPLSSVLGVAGGSALVGFQQEGAGASARTVQAKVRETVSVQDFASGEIGAGNAANDTAALLAACTYVNTRRGVVTPANGSALAYAPALFIPNGMRLKASQPLPCPASIVSDGLAIIEATANDFDIFSWDGAYRVDISGISFIGGRSQVVLKNSNVNFGLWRFDGCTFSNSADYAVRAENTSGTYPVTSTQLVMNDCRWNACRKQLYTECDHAWINGGWSQLNASNFDADSASIYSAGLLHINRHMAVPFAANETQPSRSRWIDNHGGLRCHQVRFGGEGGGIPVVYHFAAPNRYTTGAANSAEVGINLEQCSLYGGPSGRSDAGIINLRGELPSLMRIAGCVGPIDRPYIVNEGVVNGGMDLAAYLSALAASWVGDDLQSELGYHFVGNKMRGGQAMWPSELTPYVFVDYKP